MVMVWMLLLIWSLPFKILSSSRPAHLFLADGKYCLLDREKVARCHSSISIHTRHPYVVLVMEDQSTRELSESIHVERILSQNSNHNSSIKFEAQNLSHPLFQHTSFLFTLHRDGILTAQPGLESKELVTAAESLVFKKVSHHHHLCESSNLLPGRWRYDPNHLTTDENRWENCPSLKSLKYFNCPDPYYASQYFPDSSCLILPLRVSLTLLYHHLKKEGSLLYHTQQPSYFQFFGDSFGRQLSTSAACESESDNWEVFRPSFKWSRFFRNDLPCSPSCLSDPNYLVQEGSRYQRFEGAPTPCSGCPDGKKHFDSAVGHPELFSHLYEIPTSVRVLVLNGGAWFSRDWYVENNDVLFQDAVRAFIPELAKLQESRNYALDIYFLPLPGIDASLSKSELYEWDQFEERNRFLYDIFSPSSLAAYNLTVTIIPGDRLFLRKNMSGGRNVFSPDNFHYCAIGVFSPPTFLFQLIAHHHVNKALKAKLSTL